MNEEKDWINDDGLDEEKSDEIGEGVPPERLREALNRREEKRFRPRGYRAGF